MELKSILEAAIFAANSPLSVAQLSVLFDEAERPLDAVIKEALKNLTEDCKSRGVELKELASGYQFQSRVEYAPWISKLWEERPIRYSRALLETLVLIAYRQPITRADIETIRGVAVSTHIIKTLLDREWVRVVGQREVPGRPSLYGTTKRFLDYFNLKGLQELPTLDQVQSLEEMEEKLTEQLHFNMDESVAATDAPMIEEVFAIGDNHTIEVETYPIIVGESCQEN